MEDAPVTVQEDYIDSETHSYRMDSLRRNNEQARSGIKRSLAQQSYEPAQTCVGNPDLVAKYGISGTVNNCQYLTTHATSCPLDAWK